MAKREFRAQYMSMPLCFMASLSPLGSSWRVWLPYLAATLVFAIGLVTFLGRNTPARRGLDNLTALGPLFFAIPLAVFGAEHFAAADSISGMVPRWIPGHLFWALFVGTCLIAAALSIAAGKYTWLSAALFAVMIFLFVVLIHIPEVVAAPRNHVVWVVALRDLAFSAGGLALAVSQPKAWAPLRSSGLLNLARLGVGVSTVFLGVMQLLHPESAPGVPLELNTPGWVPGHAFWGYPIGALFVAAGICLIANQRGCLAATWMGAAILFLVLVIYLPILVQNPADIGIAANYFFDTLLMGGTALTLAGALGRNPVVRDLQVSTV